MRLIACLALLMMPVALPVHAQSPAPIEQRMTEAEFKSAGLDKLSAEELARLNAWLAAPAQVEERRSPPSPEPKAQEEIVSRIPGVFRGWQRSGEVITLENGQRWQIVQVSAPLVVNTTNPVATVAPAALGSWSLRIEGYNARAKVRQIK